MFLLLFVWQLEGFAERRMELFELQSCSAYEKQKSRLAVDFCAFLESHSEDSEGARTARSPFVASPEDVIMFLFSRDSNGRTTVHRSSCEFLGLHGPRPCACPTRLAAGTLDSMVGKLQAFFNSIGRQGPYSSVGPSGNPCQSQEVKLWLKSSVKEQRRARVTPHQSAPFFSEHLRHLVQCIRERLRLSSAQPFFPERYVFLRDLAFFTCQWFAGDRAHDIGNLIGRDVSRLDSGNIVMNHRIGKTVRESDGDLVVIPVIPEEPDLCPVSALDEYVFSCKSHGIDVLSSYLFRPLEPRRRSSLLSSPFTSSNATKRLRTYMKNGPYDVSSLTAHGLRAGCAITLLLLDCSPDEVKAHCRWASDRVFRHYTRLERVTGLESSANALRKGLSDHGEAKAAFYNALNNGSGFSPAF